MDNSTKQTARSKRSGAGSGLSDFITVLRHPSLPMAKTLKIDGSVTPYSKGKFFSPPTEYPVNNIRDLSRILTTIQNDPHAFVVRGQYVGDDAAKGLPEFKERYVLRRQEHFTDISHHWAMIEVDNFTPNVDPINDTEAAIYEYIHAHLPPPFHKAAFHWQLSNSAGLEKYAGMLKVHLWFWLATPYASDQLRGWKTGNKINIDASVFNPIQVHYTATPVMGPGMVDNIAVRCGFVEGATDDVPLTIEDTPPRVEKAQLPPRSAAGGDDPIARLLYEKGMVHGTGRQQELLITCPRADFHTSESCKTATIYYLPHTGGFVNGNFKCLHAHCLNATQQNFLDDLGYREDWPEIKNTTGTTPGEFPINAMPRTLQDAAEEVARFTKTDVASAATVGLSVTAVAIGKAAQIEERRNLLHYTSLFTTIIAGSGERKSPVYKAMARPLEMWASDREQAYADDVARTNAANVIIDVQLAKLKRDAGKAVSDSERDYLISRMVEETVRRKPLPPTPRLFTSDCTEERLFQKMHDHDGAFAVLSGEGRQIFDSILGRYSGGSRTGDGIYLAGISGDSITRDRVGNEKTGTEDKAIHNPCLNVCVMVQPDKYLELMMHPSLKESGLIARILPVRPVSLIGTRFEAVDEPDLNLFAMAEFYDTVSEILNHQGPGHIARLSPEAKEARRLYHNSLELRMANGGDLESDRDIASKDCTQVTKIALVFHILENHELLSEEFSEISLETWMNAQSLGGYFLATAVGLRAGGGFPGKVADWLRERGKSTVTAREVMREGPRPRPDSTQEVESMMTGLAEQGIVRRTDKGWSVNPKLYTKTVATVAVSPGVEV